LRGELGALLICEADFDIASVSEGEVSLDRAQTIMQGAPSCTFRYKFAPRQFSLQGRRTGVDFRGMTDGVDLRVTTAAN
jgi:L-2-amino-thiazoline-4-carboxylic acid hydrolase